MSSCGCEVNGQLIVGQEVTLTAYVVDDTGAAVNPDSVAIKVKLPDDTVETLSPVLNPVTGTFVTTFVLPQAGDYVWRFDGTGSFIAIGEQTFSVIESAFG